MTKEQLLEKAKKDYPPGTEFISVFGAVDISKGVPYIQDYNGGFWINLDGKKQDGRVIYNSKGWATILSKPESPEFVLPEKWCIKITAENLETVGNYYNRKGASVYADYDKIGLYYSSHNLATNIPVMGEDNFGADFVLIYSESRENFTEITFDQFKKYVLKQNNMEKKILGYKLKYENLNNVVQVITGFDYDFYNLKDELGYKYISVRSVEQGGPTNCYNKLVDAKVLDLWFEPIYGEEKIKISDYEAQFSTYAVKFGCEKIKIEDLEVLRKAQGLCKRLGLTLYSHGDIKRLDGSITEEVEKIFKHFNL